MSRSWSDAGRALPVTFLASSQLGIGIEPLGAVAQAAAAIGRENQSLSTPLAGGPVATAAAGEAVLGAGQALPVALLVQPECRFAKIRGAFTLK